MLFTPPTEHYDYDAIEGCPCPLCARVRENHNTHKLLAESCQQHPYDCKCSYCKESRKSLKILRGSSVQRDLYSELTFAYRNMENKEYLCERAFMAIYTYPKSQTWWSTQDDKFTIKQWRNLLNLA